MRFIVGLALIAFTAPLPAQDEQALARALEGKSLVVSVDMPGATAGVDVWPWGEPKVDYSDIGQRTRRYGVAIPKGSTAMITKIRVRKKEIEVQLDGGGYSGSSGGGYISTTVPKSKRERDLEADLKIVTNESQKREIRAQLRDVQSRRQREESRLRAEAEQARILREAEERELRARSGSRFNLRYKEGVPEDAATVESVMAALSGLAALDDGAGAGPVSAPRAPAGNPMALRKGLTEGEVLDLMGAPAERTEDTTAGLTIVNARYDLEGSVLHAKFAEGVLISWTMESR